MRTDSPLSFPAQRRENAIHLPRRWSLTPERVVLAALRRWRPPVLALAAVAWVLFSPVAGGNFVDVARSAQKTSLAAAVTESEPGPAAVYRRQVDDIRHQIQIHEKGLDAADRRETDIIAELDAVEQQVQRIRRKTARLDAQLAELDRQLVSAAAASVDLEQRIGANERYLARRLVAWYKLNRLGEIHLLASADNVVAFMQRKDALERILGHDESVRQNLLSHQSALERLQERLAARRREKLQRVAEKQGQLELMSQRLKARARLLAEVRRRKDLQLAALEQLRRAADQLDRKFAALGHQNTSSNLPAHAVAKPFSDYKGLLNMPVEGNIINLFGPYRNTQFNVTNFRSGIDIETDKGEPVRAVHTGKILYASWFKGYGNMMILDHGANYYSVYAHVEEMFKSIGDRVRAGDVIATVGDTGSMTGARLYFEIRHHGKPVDPQQWLK